MARSKSINTILNLKDNFSSKFKKTANLTKDQSKQMKKLDHHMGKFKKTASNTFTSVAKKAGVAASAFIGVQQAASKISEGIQFVKDYQASLTNLQAATGATAAETEEMKKQITDLYKQNMGESWSDLASSMAIAKQVTGQVGEELKQTTAMAVTYRDVFGEDVTQSVKAADTMMKNFGITAEQSFNLLAQGHQKGLNKSDELLDTANEYSVYYKTLGYSANEMFNQFAAGLETGAFNLDKVGDAVKEFGIRIKDDSKLTNEAIGQLFAPDDIVEWTDALTKGGVKSTQYMDLVAKVGADTATQMVKNLQKGGKSASDTFTTLESIMGDGQNILNDLASGAIQGKDAMQLVIAKLAEIEDPIEKSTIGVALFGTQFEDMEADVIAALGTARSQFDMTTDTMGEINKIKYNSATQAFQGIGRLVETSVLVPIADKLLPKLSEFGQWFSDNTPKIEEGIDKAFAVGAQLVERFGLSIAWAKDNADWIIPTIAGLTAAITAQKVIGTISGLYKTWTTVTKGMTAAQVALNFAAKSSPLGLIATAIGLVIAAGVYLWKNWDTIKEKAAALWGGLKKTWGAITAFTTAIFNNMKNKASSAFDNLGSSIKDKMQKVENWLASFPLGQSVLRIIKDMVTNAKLIFNGIITFVTSVFKGDWEGAWKGITQVFKGTLGIMKTYAKAPINLIIGLFKSMSDKAGAAIDRMKELFINKVSGIRDWLSSFPLGQGLLATLEGMYLSVKDIFGGIITFVTSVFKGDWEGAWNGIVQSFSGIFNLLKTYAKAPLNGVIGLVNTMIDKINNFSIDIPEFAQGLIGTDKLGFSIQHIPTFGLGTPYFTGGLARINERNGGEIVNLPSGSQVIPADKSQQLIDNSRGETKIEIHIHGNIIGEEEEVNRIMTKAVAKLKLASGNV